MVPAVAIPETQRHQLSLKTKPGIPVSQPVKGVTQEVAASMNKGQETIKVSIFEIVHILTIFHVN